MSCIHLLLVGIVDLHHRRTGTSPGTLHLGDREQAIRRDLSNLDTKRVTHMCEKLIGTVKHATGIGAHL